MKKILLLVVLPFSVFAQSWSIETFDYDPDVPLVSKVSIRAGFLDPEPGIPFRGNILYLEGLGDSFRNHDPLFKKLAAAGYRVIGFDYMGQGGSTGSMNHTRVLAPVTPSLQISAIAEEVWRRFRNPRFPEKDERVVLGWSTGGLAGYEMATRAWADRAILIAPGICVRASVGEGLKHGNEITIGTLTSASKEYSTGKTVDPHVDPIRPTSPLKVPLFATNLMMSAKALKKKDVPAKVKGFVALSGEADSYVNTKCTEKTLKRRAPHFEYQHFPSALHEIDNERKEVSESLASQIVGFLKRTEPAVQPAGQPRPTASH